MTINVLKLPSYQKGRSDGFNRGKEQGFIQGRNDSIKNKLERQRHLNALVITSAALPTLEIGILQPLNELKSRGVLDYAVKYTNEVTREDVAASSHVIFLRMVEPTAYQYLEWAHELGKKTIYFIDDNFLAIDPSLDIGKYYLLPERMQTYLKFLKNSHFVKVDSAYFGDYIRKYFNPNVIYFPASVDFASLDPLEKRRKKDEKIVIGYEGGNKETAFTPVVSALLKVLDRYGKSIKLKFYGFTPSRLIGHSNVTSVDIDRNYKEFIKKLYQDSWDIGLAPLDNNHFDNCKTNNKFREYSACWIPGIYSNVPAYADWVNHGESGLLVENSHEGWYEAIATLIEDKGLRNRIAEHAGQHAREQFRIETCADHWENQLFRAEVAL